MFTLSFTNGFKRDFKLFEKRKLKIAKIEKVFKILAENGKLPADYKPHKLSGNFSDCWECHIENDWLLIWKEIPGNIIALIRTGTHSDLF